MLKAAAGLLGIALALFAIAPEAHAKSKILGKSGGFTYAKASTTMDGPGSGSDSANAKCPNNMVSVSGGASISSEPGDSYLSTSSKVSLRQWFTEGWHITTDVSKIQSYAICTKKLDQYSDATDAVSAPAAPASVEGTAYCEEGSVVGGGARTIGVSPDWALHSTVPVDDLDAGTVPDDGWFTSAFHRDGAASSMLADAFCLIGPVPEYVFEEEDSDDPTQTLKAKCPAGTVVVGGGAFATGNVDDAHIVKTVPYDSKDKDKVPDDGWTAKSSNDVLPAMQLTFRAYAVCR